MLFTKIKSEVYDSCSTVTLAAMVKAIVHNDLSGFVKSGKPQPDQLQAAWDKVFNEYLSLTGDTHVAALLSLLKEIAILTNRLQLIELLVASLSEHHDERLATQLQKLGFRFQYKDGPDLQRELELTIIQSKQQLIRLEQNKAELQEMQGQEQRKATEQDYEEQLTELSKFQGYELHADTLTVAKYCAILKRYKNFYKPTPQNGSR